MSNSIFLNKMNITKDFESGTLISTAFPSHVTLIISNVCQLRCRFCHMNHDGQGKFIAPETVLKMHWLQCAETICISGSGEALVHPNYPEIIKNVREVAPNAKITLYTNGVGLFGKNLDATLAFCDGIHISVNSIVRKTHKEIIYKDKYDILIKNLIQLAKLRPKSFHVKLSFVLVKKTIAEVYKSVDFASSLKFHVISFLSGSIPNVFYNYSLKEEDFHYEDVDSNQLKRYGAQKGITVEYRPRTDQSCYGICTYPWSYLLIYIDWRGHIALCACCNGNPNVFIREEDLPNIDMVWNNDRFQLMRATVNDEEKIMANKLCLSCRMRRTYPAEKRNQLYQKLNIPYDPQRGSYIFFKELWLNSESPEQHQNNAI